MLYIIYAHMIIYYYIMPASSNGVNTATVRPLLRIMIIVITSDVAHICQQYHTSHYCSKY